jgi:hypothetical protein
MAIRTELSLRLPNSPGALGRVCGLLSEERVSILALHLESSGRLRLVVDNPLHAAGLLRERQHEVEEHEVLYVLLSNTPGALAGSTRLLVEAGVNVEYAYGSAVEGAPQAAAIFGVADARRAATASGL